jgi:hypothetical protein
MADTTYISKQADTLMCDSIKVYVYNRQFGLLREIITSAFNGSDSSSYKCIIGSKLIPPFNNAVTITHPNAQVTIAGATNIIGNMELTSKGITKGNIFGIRNYNGNYIEGNIITDENLQARFFNDSLITSIFNYNNVPGADSLLLSNTIIDNNFISRNLPNQNYVVKGNLILGDSLYSNYLNFINFTVEGKTTFSKSCFTDLNLTIKSDSIIVIGNNCHIENALLISKSGIICDNSSFKNTQLIARDSVIISSSFSGYPSVIVNTVNTSNLKELNSHITLINSIVNGTIIQNNSIVGQVNNKSKITIDKQSKVQGIIYSDNNVELSGKLYGSIYTYNFYYYSQPGEYINWLVDVNINREKLDAWFLLPEGFKSKNNYEIISEKWLY